MSERLKRNKKTFWSAFKFLLSVLYGAVSALVIFFPLDEMGIPMDSWWTKILGFVLPGVVALIGGVIWVYLYPKVTKYEDAQRSLVLRYGDIWRYAFPKRDKKRIVVVNVNTAFDTLVDDPSVSSPLVEKRSVHGQWITELGNRGITVEEIDKAIEDSIFSQGLSPTFISCKARGKNKEYPLGTVAACSFLNTTFYLVALSSFDINNNAHLSKSDYIGVIDSLVDYIGRYSQGYDVYLPVMGAGLSRTDIDDQTALEIMKSHFMLNKEKLHNQINIIVYNKNRDKVSLEG